MSPLRAHITKAAARDRAADVAAELDPAGRAPGFNDELNNLADMVSSKRVLEIPGKLSDVALRGQTAFAKATGTNLPLVGAGKSVKEARKRQQVWRSEFSRYRLPFSEHYLSSGADFGKPDQVRAAFLAAGREIDASEALAISVSMSDRYKGLTKAAASAPSELVKMFQILSRAKSSRKALGADAADRLTMKHLGSVYGVANKRFYNQVGMHGITPRTPATKVESVLAGLLAPKPAPPAGPLQQSVMPFMKQAGAACPACGVETGPGDYYDRRNFCADCGHGKSASLTAHLRKAYNATHTCPTPEQARAGNYRKGRVNYKGLRIAIENPPGSVRRGVDDNGAPWERVLTCAYGYFTGVGHAEETLRSRFKNRVSNLAPDADAVRVEKSSAVSALRRERDHGVSEVGRLRKLLGGHGAAPSRSVAGSGGQRSGLPSGELPLGYQRAAGGQQAQHAVGGGRWEKSAFATLGEGGRVESAYGLRENGRGLEFGGRSREVGGAGAEGPPRSRYVLLHGGDQVSVGLGKEARCNEGSAGEASGQGVDVFPGRGTAQQKVAGVRHQTAFANPRRENTVPDCMGGRAGYPLQHVEAEAGLGMGGRESFYGALSKAARMPVAADGDAVDVFIGPDHDSDLVVVVDQYKGRSFDESKFCIGVNTQAQGEALYLSNYPRGWKLGPVSTTTVQQLKKWLKEGDTKSPFKGQMVKAASEDLDYWGQPFGVNRGGDAWAEDIYARNLRDVVERTKSASMGDMTSEDWANHQDWLYDLERKSPGKLDGLFPQRAAAARPFGQMPEGYADRFHKRLKAELGQDKAAALRPLEERMRRLRARRGECYECGKPNQDPYPPCGCGIEKEAGLAQRAVGRVVTNIVKPDGYGAASHLRAILKRGPAANLKAIISDTPAYRMHADRDLPYRRLFGLPAHREGVGHFTKNGPGSFRFSSRNPDGRASLEEVGDHGLAAIRKGDDAFGGWNKTMGNYTGKVQPDGLVSYRDRWDLDLAPGDKVNSGSKLLRWLSSKVTSPVTIEGRINPRNPLFNSLA